MQGKMVPPAGFEPATCPLGGGCAIQLCHGGVMAETGGIAAAKAYHRARRDRTPAPFEPLSTAAHAHESAARS